MSRYLTFVEVPRQPRGTDDRVLWCTNCIFELGLEVLDGGHIIDEDHDFCALCGWQPAGNAYVRWYAPEASSSGLLECEEARPFLYLGDNVQITHQTDAQPGRMDVEVAFTGTLRVKHLILNVETGEVTDAEPPEAAGPEPSQGVANRPDPDEQRMDGPIVFYHAEDNTWSWDLWIDGELYDSGGGCADKEDAITAVSKAAAAASGEEPDPLCRVCGGDGEVPATRHNPGHRCSCVGRPC